MRASSLPALLLGLVALAAPAAALPPQGCTFQPPAYACLQEEASGQDCREDGAEGQQHTAVGAGLVALAGASAAGVATCGPQDTDYVTASASLGATYVTLTWVRSGPPAPGCSVFVSASGAPASQLPCPADQGPPNPGWGRLLG